MSAVLYSCRVLYSNITPRRQSPNLLSARYYFFFWHQVSLVILTELCNQNIPLLYTCACVSDFLPSKLFKNWSQIWPGAESGPCLVRSSPNPENFSLPVVPGHSGCTANPTPPYHFCQPTPSSHLWFNSPGYRQMGVFLKPKKNKLKKKTTAWICDSATKLWLISSDIIN